VGEGGKEEACELWNEMLLKRGKPPLSLSRSLARSLLLFDDGGREGAIH